MTGGRGEAAQGQEIALAEMIETLRCELETAQMEGAARPVAFGVEKVELELKVVLSRKAKADGGIKFWVVTAGTGVEAGSETVHNFKLTLSPLDAATKKRLEVASQRDRPVDQTK
jgi:hypothetical protein